MPDRHPVWDHYPPAWPACHCGLPVMDGHLTCGRAQCGTEAEAEIRAFVERGRSAQTRIDELLAEVEGNDLMWQMLDGVQRDRRTTHMTDEEAIARAAADFAVTVARPRPPMELVLRPETVVELAGALQLATRHPRFKEHPRVAAAVERFLAAARAYFADCPPILEVLRQGDDPRHDR